MPLVVLEHELVCKVHKCYSQVKSNHEGFSRIIQIRRVSLKASAVISQ